MTYQKKLVLKTFAFTIKIIGLQVTKMFEEKVLIS